MKTDTKKRKQKEKYKECDLSIKNLEVHKQCHYLQRAQKV